MSTGLTETTKKDAPEQVLWTRERLSDFQFLCSAFSDQCLLHVPVCGDIFIVQTDASSKGIGGVFSVCRNGEELPVAFYSRQLMTAYRNYSATDLEGQAVVSAVRNFEVYLVRNRFTLETDHRALSFLKSAK